ncbi:MAG: Hint domain-containing protein [bacterium]|nr:Hint domain-containing protein [bacterium]
MNQKGFINIIIIMFVVILVGAGAYFRLNRQTTPSTPIACTQEAKQCPDGSYVIRTGKNCEFALCPSEASCEGGKCPAINPLPVTEKIIRKAREQEGSFLIQKINSDSVNGLWYQAYPVARGEGTLKTLHIGDDIGYACEGVSEKLISIDFSGQRITFTKVVGQPPSGGCPICLAGNTLIDTPSGSVAVQDLQVGMPIWTTDKSGQRVSGVVQKTSRVSVPPTHRMVHLVLDDGRELFASPGHPTIDGRIVGDLVANDFYDVVRVVVADRVTYGDTATYDILPSGETGFYWANGILLDSTLH